MPILISKIDVPMASKYNARYQFFYIIQHALAGTDRECTAYSIQLMVGGSYMQLV